MQHTPPIASMAPWTTPSLLCLAVLLVAPLTGWAADAGGLSPQRQEELIYLLRQDCGSCHGMTLKGGLGPPLLPQALAGKPDHYLQEVIGKGVPGKAMPPWESILTPEEIAFLVHYLQTGTTP